MKKPIILASAILLIALTLISFYYFSIKEKNIPSKQALSKDNDNSIENLTSLLEKDPSNPDLRFELGKTYYDKKRYAEANRELLGVLDISPRHFKALSLLGTIYNNSGDREQARWFYRSALDAEPDSEEVKGYLALIDLSDNKTSNELKDDSTWLKHYLAGDAYYKAGKLDEALEELKEAVRLNPDDSRSYFLLGTVYRSKKDTQNMRQAWEKAAELNPNDQMISALLRLADSNSEENKKKEGLVKSIEKNPGDWQKKIELAGIYIESTSPLEYNTAIILLKDVIKMKPDHPSSYLSLAEAYEKLENPIKALSYYNTYMEKGGDEEWVPERILKIKEYEKIANESDRLFKDGALEDSTILIPKGEFTMGDWYAPGGGGVDEEPPQKKYLAAYHIDQFEVTQGLYKKFIDASGYKSPVYWIKRDFEKGKWSYPVVYVSWYDAASFCNWAGKSLPAEAEWEKAARGTDSRRYPWGDEFKNEFANTGSSLFRIALPVGAYSQGVSPYGVYNMAGNIAEWTNDWYKAYLGSTLQRDAFGEKYKVVRGGSYLAAPLENSRNTARDAQLPIHTHRTLGFRCVIN